MPTISTNYQVHTKRITETSIERFNHLTKHQQDEVVQNASRAIEIASRQENKNHDGTLNPNKFMAAYNREVPQDVQEYIYHCPWHTWFDSTKTDHILTKCSGYLLCGIPSCNDTQTIILKRAQLLRELDYDGHTLNTREVAIKAGSYFIERLRANQNENFRSDQNVITYYGLELDIPFHAPLIVPRRYVLENCRVSNGELYYCKGSVTCGCYGNAYSSDLKEEDRERYVQMQLKTKIDSHAMSVLRDRIIPIDCAKDPHSNGPYGKASYRHRTRAQWDSDIVDSSVVDECKQTDREAARKINGKNICFEKLKAEGLSKKPILVLSSTEHVKESGEYPCVRIESLASAEDSKDKLFDYLRSNPDKNLADVLFPEEFNTLVESELKLKFKVKNDAFKYLDDSNEISPTDEFWLDNFNYWRKTIDNSAKDKLVAVLKEAPEDSEQLEQYCRSKGLFVEVVKQWQEETESGELTDDSSLM